MYAFLLTLHSLLRWLVVLSLSYAVFIGFRGWYTGRVFTRRDNFVRHTTATLAHTQLTVGYLLYFNSPVIAYFRSQFSEARKQPDLLFFGLIHIALMTLAVVLITIGSSAAKRQVTDTARFRTLAIWMGLGFLVLFAAIPWPFSPLAQRPLLRSF